MLIWNFGNTECSAESTSRSLSSSLPLSLYFLYLLTPFSLIPFLPLSLGGHIVIFDI